MELNRFKFKINSKLALWIPLCLIFGIAFSLPFSTRINSFLTVLLILYWVLENDFKAKFHAIKKYNVYYLLIFYLINIIGLLYTTNLSVGFGILVKRSTLLLFPIIFSWYFIDSKRVRYVATSFFLSCFAAVTYSLALLAYWNYTKNEFFIAEFAKYYNYNFLRQILCMPLGIHPTYFSIFLLFAVLLGLWNGVGSFQKKNYFICSFYFASSLFLLVFALFLVSRMPIIAFLSVLFLIVLITAWKKGKIILIPIFVSLVSLGVYFSLQHPIINQRFVEMKNTDWSPPKGIYHNSTNIRIGILVCAISKIKENLVFGTGTGDMQDELNRCYSDNDFSDVLYKFNYNTHSVFLDAQLMLGLLGTGSLFILFYFGFKVAWIDRNYIYLIFILFWGICGISESLLNTQKGIIFFSLFNSMFFVYSARNIKRPSEQF